MEERRRLTNKLVLPFILDQVACSVTGVAGTPVRFASCTRLVSDKKKTDFVVRITRGLSVSSDSCLARWMDGGDLPDKKQPTPCKERHHSMMRLQLARGSPQREFLHTCRPRRTPTFTPHAPKPTIHHHKHIRERQQSSTPTSPLPPPPPPSLPKKASPLPMRTTQHT